MQIAQEVNASYRGRGSSRGKGRGMGQHTRGGSTRLQRGGTRTRGGHTGVQRGGQRTSVKNAVYNNISL
jgi:hypothetical protein